MASKERAVDRGTRLGRADLIGIGREVRAARIGGGLTQAQVGRAVGLSYSQVGRIERGDHSAASVLQLARVGAVVGLDVRVRAYPGGDALRDTGQLALLDRLRTRLHPGLSMRTEVPLPIPGDRRAWDAVIAGLRSLEGPDPLLPVEAETRLYDLQAQVRRIVLKLRDADMAEVLVVVADTGANRDALRGALPSIAELFPVPPRRALAALAAGRHPGGSALVFL